ncbi:MAG: HAD-IA family hydrolase [Cyanobacteriota bacterium]|nr:HAD-IA family hydrolase [Cyanobacteriota bacterium]
MNKFPKITHVIYDLDGLLLDTESIHAQVNSEITSRYGKVFDTQTKCKITGRKSIDSAKAIVELLELPVTPEDYLQQRNTLTYQRFPEAKPMPGAVHLTQHLYQKKIPQAVATSSSREPFNLKTKNHQEWFQLFNYIIVGDDPNLKHGKPAPDIFLIAAEKLDVSPKNCLVFEDSLAGMEAALAAGMSVVVVPDLDMDKTLFYSAHQILNSLTEFQPQLWQLPPFF